MQQHLMQMQPMMAAYYPNNVTTDHIQQYLDENKSLIIKIVESQNSGKLSECAENQARLQRNLMYLAAIADSQPQPPAMHSQFPTSGITQAGGHYGLQHQQAQQMSPQALMAARNSMLYSQQQYSALQQQALQNHLGMSGSSGGGGGSSSSGLHMMQGGEGNSNRTGGGGLGGGSGGSFGHDFGRGGGNMVGSNEGGGRGGSSGGGDGGGDNLYLKSTDQEGN